MKIIGFQKESSTVHRLRQDAVGRKIQGLCTVRPVAICARRGRRHIKTADSRSTFDFESIYDCQRRSQQHFRTLRFDELPDEHSNLVHVRM